MGDIPLPPPSPPQAADLGLCCPPCSAGTGIWKGPWVTCEWHQHPLSGLVEGSAGQGAARIPCRLSIPQKRIPAGSGSAGLAPAPRKLPGRGGASLFPIHHPYQPALAARRSLAAGLHGQRARAVRRETGRRHCGDKPRCKQKQQLSSLGTSKHRPEIYASAEPSWVLGGWGQPPGRTWAGHGAGAMVCPRGTVDSTKYRVGGEWDAGKEQSRLPCTGMGTIR